MAVALSLVRGEGKRGPGENWVRFAKDASGFILFGLGPKLGSFRKSLSRPSQMSESGAGCEREVRGAGSEELGSFRKLRSRVFQVFENGIGFVS
jgi:NAD(P)H-nitrite reductase large subunit